jgi:hypothetical protein
MSSRAYKGPSSKVSGSKASNTTGPLKKVNASIRIPDAGILAEAAKVSLPILQTNVEYPIISPVPRATATSVLPPPGSILVPEKRKISRAAIAVDQIENTSAPTAIGPALAASDFNPKPSRMTTYAKRSYDGIISALPVPSGSRNPIEEKLSTFVENQEEIENRNPYLTNLRLFVPPTRKGFYSFIDENFRNFKLVPILKTKEEMENACKTLGSAAAGQVESFLYQKFVREYIRAAAPYRGILVYHGLGSGKTCSAIAAAEALFSVANKKIIVMTPYSLRPNFQNELMFCGFRHFNVNNFWTKLQIPNVKFEIFARYLVGVSKEYLDKLRSKKGTPYVWIPNFKKEPNFTVLTDEERAEIRAQINNVISHRITFIHYNGITAKELKRIACKGGEFDDAVIIIDEIHNLTRLMQGSIVPFLTKADLSKGKKPRKFPDEMVVPGPFQPKICNADALNYPRAIWLYRMLVSAKRSKIIGLSGTPIINFPEELGILSNILGGYRDCFELIFNVMPKELQEKIRRVAASDLRIDLCHFGSDARKLTVTVLESGYIKRSHTERGGSSAASSISGKIIFDGVEKVPYNNPSEIEIGNESIEKTFERFQANCLAEGINEARTWKANYVSYPTLPPDGRTFREIFTIGGTENPGLKNTTILVKRLAGLISYYRGSKEEYMARVTKDEIVYCPFSKYSAGKYYEIRTKEIEGEKKEKEEGGDKKEASIWAVVLSGGKDAGKALSNYRARSRTACNFVFPSRIPRPFPGEELGVEDEAARLEDMEIVEAAVDPEADRRAAAIADAEDEEIMSEGAVAAPLAAIIEDIGGEKGIEYNSDNEEELKRRETEQFGGGDEENKAAAAKRAAIINGALKRAAATAAASTPTVPVSTVPGKIRLPKKPPTKAVPEPAPAPVEFHTPLTTTVTSSVASAATAAAASTPTVPGKIRLPKKPSTKAVPEPAPAPVEFHTPLTTTDTSSFITAATAAKTTKPVPNPVLAVAPKAPLDVIGNIISSTVSGVVSGAVPDKESVDSAEAAVAIPSGPAIISERLLYEQAIQRTLVELDRARNDYLNLDAESPEKQLKNYSPKMDAMLHRINATPGSALVYSQFKTLEGIGVFKIAMKANGYEEIELVGEGIDAKFSEATLRSLARGPEAGIKRFIGYTGDEARNRANIRSIFNAEFDKLPAEMAAALEPFRSVKNFKGEICKVFCITAAGAEGISLKNVRSVHIMEPYWNNTRLDQVKGRAIRICSHMDLPIDQRTVDIYTYCASFPEDNESIPFEIRSFDGGTTDEFILGVAQRKEKLIKDLLEEMKDAAVDCFLNADDNNEPERMCFGVAGSKEEALYHPNIMEDINQTGSLYRERKREERIIEKDAVSKVGSAVVLPDIGDGNLGSDGAAATVKEAKSTVVASMRKQQDPVIELGGQQLRMVAFIPGLVWDLKDIRTDEIKGRIEKDVTFDSLSLDILFATGQMETIQKYFEEGRYRFT